MGAVKLGSSSLTEWYVRGAVLSPLGPGCAELDAAAGVGAQVRGFLTIRWCRGRSGPLC